MDWKNMAERRRKRDRTRLSSCHRELVDTHFITTISLLLLLFLLHHKISAAATRRRNNLIKLYMQGQIYQRQE
jgi:hypothetical protein